MANATEADRKGVVVYDFEIKYPGNIPVSDFQELLRRLQEKAYDEPQYDTVCVAKGKEVIYIPQRLIVIGEAANVDVDSVGQQWIEFLPSTIQENITKKSRSIPKLSSIQHWIVNIILFDYPGVIFCGNGYFSTDIMIMSLAARLYNVAKSHVCGNFYNDVNFAEEPTGKEFEAQSKKRPCIILICHNVKSTYSIRQKLKWILRGTRITWEHVTPEIVDNNDNIKHCELLVGTARTIRDYVKKFDVPLTKLDSVYVTSCHLYKLKSARTRALVDVFDLIKRRSSQIISPYFFYRRHVEILPFFEGMLPENYTILSMPPKTIREHPAVKICMCNMDHAQFSIFRKLCWLKAIVEKITTMTGQKLNKSTLIICQTPETARFLSTYLTKKYGNVFPSITEYSHMVGIERARNLFRSRSTDFIVLDYASLALLEAGHIANTVLYDLPHPAAFMNEMHLLSKLSEKVDDHNNRQMYVILDPEADTEVIIPTYKYVAAIEGKIPQTFDAFYKSLLGQQIV